MDSFRIIYDVDKLRIFLRRGTNINTPVTEEGLTPLHVIVQKGWKPREVQLLLSHGANVNARDDRGRTPLHIVAESSDLSSIAWWLLEAGANPNARTLEGESVIGVASKLNRWMIVSLLIEYGADANDGDRQSELFDAPLYMACRAGNPEAALMLLDNGADLNARGREGRTLLHASVEMPPSVISNSIILINELVSRGCDVNGRDANGQTPLHLACANGSAVGVFALLRCWANIDIRDANDRTPVKVCEGFIESGGDILQISMIMLEHVEALRLVGLRKIIRHTDEVNQFFSKYIDKEISTAMVKRCREELERMRAIRIDSFTTLDQLLTKSANRMARHILNPDLGKLVDPDQYPVFGFILKEQFHNGCSRSFLLEKAYKAFQSLTLPSWHYSCMDCIFDYLEDSHLRDLIKASKL